MGTLDGLQRELRIACVVQLSKEQVSGDKEQIVHADNISKALLACVHNYAEGHESVQNGAIIVALWALLRTYCGALLDSAEKERQQSEAVNGRPVN